MPAAIEMMSWKDLKVVLIDEERLLDILLLNARNKRTAILYCPYFVLTESMLSCAMGIHMCTEGHSSKEPYKKTSRDDSKRICSEKETS